MGWHTGQAIARCWLPAGAGRPPGLARWWRAVDGAGHLGYRMDTSDDPRWEPLTPLMDLPGASHGEPARFHYVVETDIAAHAEDDFNAWYTQEHLPGLAMVAGTVRACRFQRRAGEGPLYLACYDLVTPAAMESAAWLAVRGTPWSARVRPLFRNTRRTLYVDAAAGP